MRVVVPAHASPETTCPDELLGEERSQALEHLINSFTFLTSSPSSYREETYVSVRTHLAESRMSQTLIYEVETEKTRQEEGQYFTDTTLFGWPLRVTIS